jgi:hypothetical protein
MSQMAVSHNIFDGSVFFLLARRSPCQHHFDEAILKG